MQIRSLKRITQSGLVKEDPCKEVLRIVMNQYTASSRKPTQTGFHKSGKLRCELQIQMHPENQTKLSSISLFSSPPSVSSAFLRIGSVLWKALPSWQQDGCQQLQADILLFQEFQRGESIYVQHLCIYLGHVIINEPITVAKRRQCCDQSSLGHFITGGEEGELGSFNPRMKIVKMYKSKNKQTKRSGSQRYN